jgi:hypothetical protein
MCFDPISMAMMATVVSGAVSAVGSFVQASNAASVANANAKALERQAALRQEKAKFDADQATREYQRLRGRQEALAGKSGLDAGTFADLFADSAMESALEVAQIKWTADRESENLQFQADSQRAQGQMAKVGGFLEGVGTIVGTGAKLYGQMPSKATSVTSPWQTTVYYG